MDSFARKMDVHVKALSRAIDDGDAELAKSHLQEVLKVGTFLKKNLTIKKILKLQLQMQTKEV